MDQILNMAEEGIESAFTVDELIFEEVIDDERTIIRAEQPSSLDPTGNAAYNQLADESEQLPEVRLKEDLHSLLITGVCELKERIQENTIEFKLLRAIHILQRLNEKMINEI